MNKDKNVQKIIYMLTIVGVLLLWLNDKYGFIDHFYQKFIIIQTFMLNIVGFSIILKKNEKNIKP